MWIIILLIAIFVFYKFIKAGKSESVSSISGKESDQLVENAESDLNAMYQLALDYRQEGQKNGDFEKIHQALSLLDKVADMSHGCMKVKACNQIAVTWCNPNYTYNLDTTREYFLKALAEKPGPTDDISNFNCAYSSAAYCFSNYAGNRKNAAYCLVVACVLYPYSSNELYEEQLKGYDDQYSQAEYNKWVEDARNYNFRLPN